MKFPGGILSRPLASHSGAKFSPGQKFGNLTHFVAPQNAIPGSGKIEILSCGAAKMGEVSWRDTFKTTGVTFWSKILSLGQKFGNLTHFVAP